MEKSHDCTINPVFYRLMYEHTLHERIQMSCVFTVIYKALSLSTLNATKIMLSN